MNSLVMCIYLVCVYRVGDFNLDLIWVLHVFT